MKMYVIRHGQTTGDVEDRYGGAYDDHLTPLGINQAKMMADKFLNANIEVIFASPLIRTQETARLLQAAIGVEIETVDELKERDQNGILTGMIRSEARIKYPDLAEQVRDPHNTLEGAESFDSLRKRIVEAITRIANSGFETVAVVTHGGPIRRILGDILQMEDSWTIEDCGWLLIEFKEGKYDLAKKEGITS